VAWCIRAESRRRALRMAVDRPRTLPSGRNGGKEFAFGAAPETPLGRGGLLFRAEPELVALTVEEGSDRVPVVNGNRIGNGDARSAQRLLGFTGV
jgi:hypothetical protein